VNTFFYHCLGLCRSVLCIFHQHMVFRCCITWNIRCIFWHLFPHWKMEACLKFKELLSMGWPGKNLYKYIWSESSHIIPPPLYMWVNPHLSVQSLPDILIVQVCLVFCQVLHKEKCFMYDATFKWEVILCAEEIGNCAIGRKYAVCEACVQHWQKVCSMWGVCTALAESIQYVRRVYSIGKVYKKLFSCQTDRKTCSGPRKGRNPMISASVSECYKDLWSEALPVSREGLVSKAEYGRSGNIPFEPSCRCSLAD
jgi:hypothetical protein